LTPNIDQLMNSMVDVGAMSLFPFIINFNIFYVILFDGGFGFGFGLGFGFGFSLRFGLRFDKKV
jgi:hypothetical protein